MYFSNTRFYCLYMQNNCIKSFFFIHIVAISEIVPSKKLNDEYFYIFQAGVVFLTASVCSNQNLNKMTEFRVIIRYIFVL